MRWSRRTETSLVASNSRARSNQLRATATCPSNRISVYDSERRIQIVSGLFAGQKVRNPGEVLDGPSMAADRVIRDAARAVLDATNRRLT
jgi:hypothetical protein